MENHITNFQHKHFIVESRPPENYYSYCFLKDCIICEKNIYFGSVHFHCRNCDFRFHKGCPTTLLETNQTVNRLEMHEHTLTFIRKMNIFNCQACGEVYKDKMNMYGCLQCSFFVHRNCLYLPKVIKLTCHTHRLFHTFQVLDCKNCRICNKQFVYEYGGYICIDKTCDYKLHSFCATREDIWDGKDVEREPNKEMSNFEDVALLSLEELDGKTIRHFSHHHDLMRFCVNEKEENERICQACILCIDFDSFLGCKECDFALHDICARLPLKMEHAFHRHPLTLQMNIKEGFFICSKCKRESCGFMYRCNQNKCEFIMDAKCASLADPLYKGNHKHLLTLSDSGVRCNECHFYLESKRATLPVLVKCKYDTHPLTLCLYRSITKSWLPLSCEICEVSIKPDYPDYQDLYVCNECNTTLHVECAIGKYPYLKPGHTIKVNDLDIDIASNSLSRPLCRACHSICKDKLVFKNRDAVFFCSIDCITSSSNTLSAKTN